MSKFIYVNMGEWIGEGFGQAIQELRVDRLTKQLLKLVKDGEQKMIARTVDYGDPDDPRTSVGDKEVTVVEMITEMAWRAVSEMNNGRGRSDSFWKYLEGIDSFEDLVDVYKDFLDSDWGRCLHVLPIDEHKKVVAEHRRKELEQYAGAFASESGYKVGTFEFIRAIEQALGRIRHKRERWNDSETRMEEWAAHRYAGNSAETYYDDLNFENGRFASATDHLREIMEWLETECPLLMAKYEEMKLAGTWENDEEAEDDEEVESAS